MEFRDGFQHHFAEINGLRYHYVRQGAGPPLMLVHGWPGFYYEWHLNIGPLSQRFDVVAPDMRGYAYTDKPDLPPHEGYTPAAFADDLRALFDHLGWQRASLVAHDFGAIWVRRFARAYPERVEKLVLFNPPYPGVGARWFEPAQMSASWHVLFHQVPIAEELVGASRRNIELYLRHFLSEWSYRKDLWTDEELAHFVEAYSQPGALRGGFNCYRATFRLGRWYRGPADRSEQQLDPRVHAPTLVLWAEADPNLPPAWADRLGEFFPHHELKLVPAAGHFLQRERPELVNQEIVRFLLG